MTGLPSANRQMAAGALYGVSRRDEEEKNEDMNTKTLIVPVVAAAVLASCIDEDLSGCGADYRIDYTVRLRTNLHDRISGELTAPAEQAIGREIETALGGVFTDVAHDVDLSFYTGHTLAHHEAHQTDASTSSFTVYLSVADYRHLALANCSAEPAVTVEGRDADVTMRLVQAAADTVDSHRAGLFAARLPMEVERRDQAFDVSLDMQNCSAALVIDMNGHAPEEMSGYVTGLACGFSVNDSVYDYSRGSVMRAQLLAAGGYSAICATGFPSPDATRADGGDGLWQIRVYVKENGRYTESVLHVSEPLAAGGLKIIKARIGDGGQVVTDAPEVGVSVILDWKPGGDHEVEM